MREKTDTACPACGNAVATTTITERVDDHRLTIHVHLSPTPPSDAATTPAPSVAR